MRHAAGMDGLQHGRVGVDEDVGEAVYERARHLVADRLDGRRRRAERHLLFLAVRRVRRRGDPLRGALEESQLAHLVHDRRHDLNATRAGADDADALPRDRHVVIPAGTVEARTRERAAALDVGVRGVMQHARRGDDHVGLVGRAVSGLESPAPVLEGAASYFLAVPDARVDAVATGYVPEIRQDLRPQGEALAPLRIEGEGVAVEVRRDVAGEPGIRVLAPRATDAVGLLVDDDVLEAGFSVVDRSL